jgi:hypothetical protein
MGSARTVTSESRFSEESSPRSILTLTLAVLQGSLHQRAAIEALARHKHRFEMLEGAGGLTLIEPAASVRQERAEFVWRKHGWNFVPENEALGWHALSLGEVFRAVLAPASELPAQESCLALAARGPQAVADIRHHSLSSGGPPDPGSRGRRGQRRPSRAARAVPACASGFYSQPTVEKGRRLYSGLSWIKPSSIEKRSRSRSASAVVGENLSAHEIAGLFRRYIGKLAEEQGLDPAIREETVQQCLVFYYSKPVTDRLNSCYRYRMTDQALARGPTGTYKRTATASLSGELFMRGSGVVTERGLSDEAFFRRRALAYISGVWSRFGRGPDFVFTNAHDKATLVAGLLLNLGCRDIRIESTVGLIPQANIVHFQPTDEVTEWLRKAW